MRSSVTIKTKSCTDLAQASRTDRFLSGSFSNTRSGNIDSTGISAKLVLRVHCRQEGEVWLSLGLYKIESISTYCTVLIPIRECHLQQICTYGEAIFIEELRFPTKNYNEARLLQLSMPLIKTIEVMTLPIFQLLIKKICVLYLCKLR